MAKLTKLQKALLLKMVNIIVIQYPRLLMRYIKYHGIGWVRMRISMVKER